MAFPNGPVLVDDEKTYLVAETFGKRISVFDVGEDGNLRNRRLWANTGDVLPDGMCWDERVRGLWVGNGGGKNVSSHLLDIMRVLSRRPNPPLAPLRSP